MWEIVIKQIAVGVKFAIIFISFFGSILLFIKLLFPNLLKDDDRK